MVATKAALSIRVDALTDADGKSEPEAPSIGLENRAKLESRLRALEYSGDLGGMRRFNGEGKKQQRFEMTGETKTYNTAADSVDLISTQREPVDVAMKAVLDVKEEKRRAKEEKKARKKAKEDAMDVDGEDKESKKEKKRKRRESEANGTAAETDVSFLTCSSPSIISDVVSLRMRRRSMRQKPSVRLEKRLRKSKRLQLQLPPGNQKSRPRKRRRRRRRTSRLLPLCILFGVHLLLAI